MAATLQKKVKTLHLHACTWRLGIDLIGLMDNGEGRIDCVFRLTRFRPRHWSIIVPLLPKDRPSTMGLDISFPSRFTLSGEEEEVVGGKQVDLQSLLEDSSLNEDSKN
jgi:hypothetical protein